MSSKLKGTAYQTYIAESTNSYTADANGIITGVAAGDVNDLINGGCSFLPGNDARDNLAATTAPTVDDDSTANYAAGSVWIDTNTGKSYLCEDASEGAAVWVEAGTAMGARLLNLFDVKLATGLQLAATAAAGVFGLANTNGTSIGLVGEAANSNTKTDSGYINFVLPDNYTAGADLTVTVNAKVAGAGTLGATKTIDLTAFELATDGTAGSDICATAAQTLTTSNANYAFTITGTDLLPGDLVQLKVVTAVQETAGTDINSQINSIKVAQA